MICYSSSALDNAISKSCLKGRPFGGVAIFIRSSIATNCGLLIAAPRYIILLCGDTLFINVHLPCKSTLHREEEHTDCLVSVMHDVCDSDIHYSNIVFGGDMNVDITETGVICNILMNFLEGMGLNLLMTRSRLMNVIPSELILLVPPRPSIILLSLARQ